MKQTMSGAKKGKKFKESMVVQFREALRTRNGGLESNTKSSAGTYSVQYVHASPWCGILCWSLPCTGPTTRMGLQ
jgi:hypothetical protein